MFPNISVFSVYYVFHDDIDAYLVLGHLDIYD